MRVLQRNGRMPFFGAAIVAVLLAGCSSMPSSVNKMVGYGISGDQEVPPVTTKAFGKSSIKIADDKAVSGGITFEGMSATAAHIHQGAAGMNGPVIVPLTKNSDTSFSVPAGAKLTDAQYAAYKAGNLYVNVHSVANPGGEIRMQLKP